MGLTSQAVADKRDLSLLFESPDLYERRRLQKNKMYSSMQAHDMRAALICIDNFAERLVQDPIELPVERQKHYLEIIRAESHRLGNMLYGFLASSRQESSPSGPLPTSLNLSRVSIKEELELLVTTFRPTIAKLGMRLKLTCNSDEPIIYGDAEKLSKVFLPLLDNAIQYSEAGTLIRLIVDSKARDVTVDFICQKLEAAPSATKQQAQQGHMFLDKEKDSDGLTPEIGAIIEAHGGEIKVNRQETGLKVRVCLPKNVRQWKRQHGG